MKRLAALLLILLLTCLPLFTLSQQAQAPQDMLDQWYSLGAALRENGLYPYVELRKGDKGYEVVALQTRLKELGYYKKDIVTNFGAGTEGAMRSFEKTNRLRVNGWASVEDQRLLFMPDALSAQGGTVQPGGQYAQPVEPTQAPQATKAPQSQPAEAPATSTPAAGVELSPLRPKITLDPGKITLPIATPEITLNPGSIILTQAPQIAQPTVHLQQPVIPKLPKPGF